MSERSRILVTGGVRSGKSAHAEELLAGESAVTYVAPGAAPTEDDDPDWIARIERHRAVRPDTWATLETSDLAVALATPGPVIVDCLGTWLTAVIDAAGLWEAAAADVEAHVGEQLDSAVAALSDRTARTVLVSNEVGLGVVPDHRSGRLFRDLLGTVNQRVATVCDDVHLVVAGRVLKL